jgi:hypothetical protein
MTGHDQWIRKCSLTITHSSSPLVTPTDPTSGIPIAGDAPKALNLSDFRIRFKTYQAEGGGRPPGAWIRVTNLAPDTEWSFIKEYNGIVLQAGYLNGRFGIIFAGTIKEYRRGHETVTDSFLDIWAGDGDIAFSRSAMNETLAKNWNNQQQRDKIIAQMEKDGGVQRGYNAQAIAAFAANARGTTMWGFSRSLMNGNVARDGLAWVPINGKINVVPLNGYKPGEAIELSSATGMVGWPEQTPEGIAATCLLNPAAQVGNLMHIDNKDINQSRAPGGGFTTPAIGGSPNNPGWGPTFLQPVTDDGFYRIIKVEHHGDTRGNEWYTELLGLAIDVSQPGAQQGQAGTSDHDIPVPPPVGSNLPTGDKPDTDPTSPFYSPPLNPPT